MPRLRTPDRFADNKAVWDPPPVPPPTVEELAEHEMCRALEQKILAAELNAEKFWDLKPR